MKIWRTVVGQVYSRVLAQLAKRTPGENAFLFLLPVVGLLVGLTSVATAHVIAFLQNVFWGSGTNLLSEAQHNSWQLRIIIPLGGGLVVGLIGLLFHVKTRGGGVSTIIQTLALKGGVLSLRRTAPRDWAAIVTISTGGSLGREGAMAMLASAVGSYLGRRFKLSTQQLRLLVCAAAAAALAAVYNAPIGGSLFALEILMGSFAVEILGPVVIASVISTLVFRSCMGNLPRFEVPRYEFVSSWELGFYLVLGLLAGLVSFLFVRALFGSQNLFEKLPIPRWLKPAIGMVLVGCIGVFWPHVFGNGFETVNMTLRQQIPSTQLLTPFTLLLILLVMKILASALTFGAGGAGGLFTPSLMVGALLGGVFGYGVHMLFPNISAEYGAYALVGMGGVLAGMTHAPLMAIMMVFEQTNSYQTVLPLMFVCVISHFTVRLLKSKSVEEESLRRDGVVLPSGPEASVMQSLRVADAMHDDVLAVNCSVPFPTVVERFLKEPYNNLYVTDEHGAFVGAIRLHSLKEMLHQGDSLTTVVADDLVDETFESVTPDQKLADTMDVFWRQNSERLPVVENTVSRKLIGWISKRDLIGVYNQEILQKRPLLSRFIATAHGDEHEGFIELPRDYELRTVIVPPAFSGRTLGELGLRSKLGIHVLLIKGRDPQSGDETIIMPDPQSVLEIGGRLVVIGTEQAFTNFERLMAETVAKPKT
jgi:CIC family chloride channel protein